LRKLIIIISVIYFSAALFSQENQKIYINEFLASNVSVNADIADFDDYSDWIELYNDESYDVDLGGYFLTDDLDNPARWEIPAGTIIEAKGFLSLWADGYDDIPGHTYTRSWRDSEGKSIYFTTYYYHLNFALSRAGESIGLFAPWGLLVDSVTFGLQLRDVSMGRKPDGSATWMYFSEPTPEASNTTEGTLNLQYAESPGVAPESGFYSGSQEVIITADSADAGIRYTLDGSKPAGNSESYDSAFDITQTTVLRARAFEADKLASDIINRTYFIDDNISLPVISIITPPEALWDSTIGIYFRVMKEREISVTFEFFKTNNAPEFSINAGLRLTGQASLFYPQISFTIYARERYGTDEINYQVFPERELNIFKNLYLRNAGVPDNRSTFFRDALQHTLVLNRIDIDCQAYLPSVVFLNGEYWGIYNIRDKINSNYIASIHNLNPDDIDLLEYEFSSTPVVMNGNAENYNSFYNYIETNNLSIEQNYRTVEGWMDIDEYINYQICEIYYDNVFWPDQNMRMWRERKEDGKWRWVFYDSDYGFGMPNQRSDGYTNNTLEFATSSASGFINPPDWSTLIFRKLLDNEEFETKFIQQFASYMNTIFHPDTVIPVIDRLEDNLSPEMPRHIERWDDGDWYYGDPIPSYGAWLGNVEVMRNFAWNRPSYMRQHIINYFGLSGTSVLSTVIEEPGTGSIIINNAEHTTTNTTGVYFRDIPVKLEAVPDVGYKFVRWEGVEEDSVELINIVLNEDSLTVTAVFDTVPVNIAPSDILTDTVLTKDYSPYYACNDIIVYANAALTIDSGVHIYMPENANILVYGRLIIQGTEEEPVIIAPNEYSDTWGALCFIDATDSSVISNLKITGATKGPDFTRDRAAISGYNSDFSLHNVSVENVNAPVFIQYGKVYIGWCTLKTDAAGDLINIKYAESALVENCDLIGNDEYDSDAIDYDQIPDGIIRGNRIYNFYGDNSDAIDLGEGALDILVENNIIYNISDKGVSIGGGSNAEIKRNIIANCGQGIGIKDYGSYGYVEHNTFYANHYGVASFEKNIGAGGGDADIVNCIFANNHINAVYRDQLSDADVSYSLTNTDFPDGLHNIYGEPLFLNNLYLSENSPAINTGNPLLPNDPDGSLPDMGAYPYDSLKLVNLMINEIHYNPLEGADNQFVEIVNTGISAVNINGYRLDGNAGYVFPDEIIEAGEIFLVASDMIVYEGQEYKVYEWDEGDLQDMPGRLILEDDEGYILDFVDYNSRYFWPKEPDGMGPSLELHSTSLENMASNSWRRSYIYGGTPGQSNNSVLITGIYINEFMASNSSTIADEFGDYADWIEFYNSTDQPVNLGGMYITDNLDDPCKHQIPMYAPELTTIPAKGFIIFWVDRQPEQGILHLNYRLDIFGEEIGLAQMLESETVYIDSLRYGWQTSDISFGRYPDGADNWFEFTVPTPKQSNIITSIEDEEYQPERLTLYQNYPNPFSSTTVISYQLTATAEVELSVYDLTGRRVATLINKHQQSGRNEVEWNAKGIKPGLYFCKLKAGQCTEVMKMILLK
jgi:hypothetical protein